MNYTKTQKAVRTAVRNFLLNASLEELRKEYQLSSDAGDNTRAMFVNELIIEAETPADYWEPFQDPETVEELGRLASKATL